MEQKKETLERIEIVVELDPSLTLFAVPKRDDVQTFKSQLLQYLNDILKDLTIPENISLTITKGENMDRFMTTSYHVTINDHRCRLPLPALVPSNVETVELARSVAKGICQNPELFISVSLAGRIREQWASENGQEYMTYISLDEFYELLVELVRRYFKIDRAREYFQALKDKEHRKQDARMRFEEVISGSTAVTLRVMLPDYSMFGSSEVANTQSAINDKQFEKFELMRDGLWYELGVMVPKVSVGIDRTLQENEFRVQLNDLRQPPTHGLAQGHFLVNDTVDRLSLIGILGERAINPSNGSECAIVRSENGTKETCQEGGLTTWDPLEFITLSVAAEIRRNADAFLTTEAVRFSMHQLRLAFPAVIDTALERFDVAELTGILRDLLGEEFSIRDLLGIFEALLAIHGYKETKVDRSNAVELLRIPFKRYISRKYAKSGNNLVVYLLDPRIESRILNIDLRPLMPGDEDHNQLIKAIFDELEDLPTATQNAVILTTLKVRKRLRSLIEKEFPRLAVLCYQEIDPDLKVYPLSRISPS